MVREQATDVIKQIFERCQLIEGKSIKLMPPKDNNALSNTFQIYIQTNNNETLQSCIENVAKENDLAVGQKGDFCTVYKAYLTLKETF